MEDSPTVGMPEKQAGIIRVILEHNAVDCVVLDGLGEFNALAFAIKGFHDSTDAPGTYQLTAINDKHTSIPTLIILREVKLVLLMPPPGNLTLLPPGALLKPKFSS